MSNINLIGFPQATLTNDMHNLIVSDGNVVTIVHPYDFFNHKYDKDIPCMISVVRDTALRKQLIEYIDNNNIPRASFIHKTCVVDSTSIIGPGAFLGPYASVYFQATVGSDCIIAPYAMLSHKSSIGTGSIMHPGSIVAGTTQIGKYCLLAIRSSVIDNLSICDDVLIGAGALVTKNIDTPGNYIGSPARRVG